MKCQQFSQAKKKIQCFITRSNTKYIELKILPIFILILYFRKARHMHRPQMSHIFVKKYKIAAGITVNNRNNSALNKLIIHSKYFPNSDWLKAHA